MEIIGYGEDALTLWAIKNKLNAILCELDDYGDTTKCKVFFRPSFGRRGGANSAQFGEFDFIILSEKRLYLGESKWDRSSENKEGTLELRDEQKLRRAIFRRYVEAWMEGQFVTWNSFLQKTGGYLSVQGFQKPIAPTGSLLAANLQTILTIIKNHFVSALEIKDVLLYLHDGQSADSPIRTSNSFELVSIDYSLDTIDNFVKVAL